MKAVTLTRQQAAEFSLACAIVLAFCSIAASQIFLGLALALFLSLRRRPSWPPGIAWAAAFLALTLLAALAGGEPRTALPQIKKLYLWTLLPLGSTLLARRFPGAALAWPVTFVCLASTLWSFVEYSAKLNAARLAGKDFYLAYVADRITGFMSHWMTFSAHMLFALCLAVSLLLFTRQPLARRLFLLGAAAIFAVAILLAQTRSIWLGAACAVAFLLFRWRAISLAALPVLLAAAYWLSPAPVQTRMISIVRPQGEVDSNSHRAITRETGLRMIAAHPWLGLGPEGPGKQFDQYLAVPRTVRPLPDGYYGHLHNLYMQYAAERGLPALACFLVFAAINARSWWRQRSARSQFALAVLIGLAAEALFEYNLGDSEVLTPFLALFGLAAPADSESA
jgi:putative inorganic carbon (HCO3(-)) transporter